MYSVTYVIHVTGWSQSYDTEKVIESSVVLSKIVLYSIVRVINNKLYCFVFVFVFYFLFIFFSLLFRVRVEYDGHIVTCHNRRA